MGEEWKEISFEDACRATMPFTADYKGKTLKEIGNTDKGLKDLDRLIGWMEEKKQTWGIYPFVVRYMSEPHIKKELDALL